MSSLTYYKPSGEWGIEGVDLSTLPPKVYMALSKLHDLEHKPDVAINFLAQMYNVSPHRLEDFILYERSERNLEPVGVIENVH